MITHTTAGLTVSRRVGLLLLAGLALSAPMRADNTGSIPGQPPAAPPAGAAAVNLDNVTLPGLLPKIHVSEIKAEDVTVLEAFKLLKNTALAADPRAEKINFIFRCPKAKLQSRVSLELRNATVQDVLRTLCTASGLDCAVEEHAILIFMKPPPAGGSNP